MNTLEQKFMERIFVLTYDKGCWLWVGSIGRDQRPNMKWQGRSVVPARVALILTTGRDPKDLCALHDCDNEICVNPRHLYWGTKADNGRDMSVRKRVVWDRGIFGQKGEAAYHHRFTEADVIEMRRLHWQEGESLSFIGRRFNAPTGNVHRIVHGDRWGHIKTGLPTTEQASRTTTTHVEMLRCIAMISILRTTLLRCAV